MRKQSGEPFLDELPRRLGQEGLELIHPSTERVSEGEIRDQGRQKDHEGEECEEKIVGKLGRRVRNPVLVLLDIEPLQKLFEGQVSAARQFHGLDAQQGEMRCALLVVTVAPDCRERAAPSLSPEVNATSAYAPAS